ncbi:MAG: type I restriction enzyme HsdR N-terminal domain-containing protein [Bacteroidetes bacterium]|nr:type I restriction enzyme HsdR N-terminal domain-containing protein [Bacteroidota bacterium]
MDFKDQIKQLGERVIKLKDQVATEQATKNALIMPFLAALGYDVFDPNEVVPEFICDIGTKKGEKIDYAIFIKGAPAILIECKHWGQNLSLHDGQLLRYFHVSKAKFGILTNGIIYRFYSDLAAPNKMDEKPFLEINMTDLRENQIEEVKKFHKSYFDVDSILTTASELKYMGELKNILNQELNNPSPDFVRHFAKQVVPGMVTAKVLDQFTALLKKTSSLYITDLITERLKTALTKESEATEEAAAEEKQAAAAEEKVITTQEELEAFMIVKTILRQKIPVARVAYRDAQSYFAILLDDNNRKTICRLYLNGSKKYIGTFDENKKETKIEVTSLDDIFQHSGQLLTTVENHDKLKEGA